jgi:tetratricopeptide (TPR) repeat protein
MRPADPSAEEFFEEGKREFSLGRYRQAAAAFESSIRLAPDVPNSHFLLGASRLNAGDIADALVPLAQCVYLESGHASARNGLGVTLRWLGRTEEATVHLARAAYLGNPQARATLTEMGAGYCGRCGGPLPGAGDSTGAAPPAGNCPRCAGVPPATSSPRPRTWPWAYLPEEDYRSRLSLPSSLLARLGNDHLARYRGGGDADDIDQAITYLELAAATAEPYSERPGTLTELGVAYCERFGCHGLPADLDHAIDCHEQALTTAPPGQGQARILASLGFAYSERYRHGGSIADLNRAVALLERALDDLPTDPDERTTVLANAGMIYARRFHRGHAAGDLDRSIELYEHAVAATPEDHPRRAMRMSNLAAALGDRYQDSEVLTDLDRAIVFAERAVAATPEGHRNLPIRLSNLGVLFQVRHRRTKLVTDLNQATTALWRAAAATPDGDPRLAHVLSQLVVGCLAPEEDGRSIDRQALRSLARRLAAARNSPPADRVSAGGYLGTLASAQGEHVTAVELLDAAVALLPAVAPRETDWADREHRFGEHIGLVSQAIAAHCATGDPAGAVEIAELGRGILLAAQLDSRTDLTDLERQLPELAGSFRRVRAMLSSPSAGNRQVLWTRYEDLVGRIRAQPCLGRFLRPRLDELRPAASGGTVIMVNSGRQRADAILIGPDTDPVCVPLPALMSGHVATMADALLKAIRAPDGLAGSPQRKLLPAVLGWLWDTIVLPVDEALPAAARPRRVWWLPVGLLGLFPLHAAGRSGQPGALDTFVSSYIPTMRMLAYAHERPPATARRQLTIALAHTPGLPDLPGTIAEARDLTRNHASIPPLLDTGATVDRVRAALPNATWAHFACHAQADHSAPSRGGLHLSNGMLTIPEVSRLRLANAELAYLSACSTAHRSHDHADESINLASAFHLAGFRHVIASLWPLQDDVAADASRRFYRAIPHGPSAADAALALHQVTHVLRDKHPDRPDLWAALIHSGP